MKNFSRNLYSHLSLSERILQYDFSLLCSATDNIQRPKITTIPEIKNGSFFKEK